MPRNDNYAVSQNQYTGMIRCNKCGKLGHQASVCRLGTNLCFACGKPGHTTTNCPSRSSAITPTNQNNAIVAAEPPIHPNTVNKGRKFAKGRAYAITFEQAQDAKDEEGFDVDVLQGIVYIHQDQPVACLFDTGASHSFISIHCVDKYKLPTEMLSYTL